MKKHCGSCISFMKLFKTVAHSNSGKEMEKIQKKNCCTRFDTQVSPNGGICRHWNGVVEEDGDENE